MKGHVMTPHSHIQVATDFSGCAARAVDRAARLAHDHRATLHLVHVMDRLLLQMFAGTLDEHPLATEQRLIESARSRLKELARLQARGRMGGAHRTAGDHSCAACQRAAV